MKTFYVVAVVLSLTSVCQAASLACEKLLKPVDKAPNYSGSLYVIATSMDSCFFTTLVSSFIWPSIEVNITPKDTSNVYTANYKFKIYGYCETESEDFMYENNTMFDFDSSNNASTDVPDVLLQTCPDCIAVNRKNSGLLLLLSRRKNVTAAELKEFETQAECLGLSKPQVLNSDYDYENCLPLDEDNIDIMKLLLLILQRLKDTYRVPLNCFQTFLNNPSLAFQFSKELWDTVW